MAEKKRVRVTLVKSPIGCKTAHRHTVRGLGLRKLRQTVEVEDSPAVRGMLTQVAYLVRVES
jgi:large subunit ribosomal protein L30